MTVGMNLRNRLIARGTAVGGAQRTLARRCRLATLALLWLNGATAAPPVELASCGVASGWRERETAAHVSGFTSPRARATLSAARAGRIESYRAREGESVESGQVVAVCRDEALEARAARAELASESTTAEEIALAQLDRAARELHWLRSLDFTGSAARKELEDAHVGYVLAHLHVERSRHERRMAQADREVERAAVGQLRLRAPFAGIVVRQLRQPGEFVREGDPLVELADLRTLLVECAAPLASVHGLRPDQDVCVEPVDAARRPRAARVMHVSAVADAASQTTRVRLEVENSDGEWIAGMKVLVELGGVGSLSTAGPSRPALEMSLHSTRESVTQTAVVQADHNNPVEKIGQCSQNPSTLKR